MHFLKHNWFFAGILFVIAVVGVRYTSYLEGKNTIAVEAANKEYSMKKKAECLDIYKIEATKWNNVNDWDYSESSQECTITYRETNPKSEKECEDEFQRVLKIWENDDTALMARIDALRNKLLCLDGTFEKTF